MILLDRVASVIVKCVSFVFPILIASSASAQDVGYLQPLVTPPIGTGTCIPVPTTSLTINSEVVAGTELIMKSAQPGSSRELLVYFNKQNRPIGYSEVELTSIGLGTIESNKVVARLLPDGRIDGFRGHNLTSMPVEKLKGFDTASLREMRKQTKTTSSRAVLTKDEQKRVRELVEWMRKRCPG